MSSKIFEQIDRMVLEIMDLIENEPFFPLLSKNVDSYISTNSDNARLYLIYIQISKLRKI